MARPARAADHQWFGDKRSQVVHDLDRTTDACALDDLLAAETYLVFAPDTLVEARNRGYTLATPGKRRRFRSPRS